MKGRFFISQEAAMSLAKHYQSNESESHLQAFWQETGVYHFDPNSNAPVYSVDTPPPTVSGHLHLGHVYSYSHPDFIARFWRMNGHNVYYPMGYDDNGLPTERLVEKREGVRAAQVGRQAFIERCLQVSEEAEKDYQALWQRLGLSIDWRYTYRSIDENSRRICQWSFIDLVHRGLAYRKEAPAIWCPECRTAIAQAELNDLERESEFVTLGFDMAKTGLSDLEGQKVLIATTRPELLPACVAIFVHPEDARYRKLIGQQATVPIFGQSVPILADPAADPEKGTGAVMCCTFGDTTDVAWWRTHNLPLIEAVDRAGRMTAAAGEFSGLSISAARKAIKQALETQVHLLDRQPTTQSIRVHERCDTPVEYIVVKQWFVNVLDFKEKLLAAGEQIRWHPEQMAARYRAWVENLNWDWCISRQRYFGVPFPVWYCQACGETILADEDSLPIEPTTQSPHAPCPKCGGTTFTPEEDIFDTWMTSSVSPQIAGKWGLGDQGSGDQETPYSQVFPYTLRPQAHEIIRTWAFYTIVKSLYHFDTLPWTDVLISGWGLAGEGLGKISKSRGGGPMAPLAMIEKYSADAVRYWAASTAPGKDSVISEEKIQMGGKLVTKLWNVARFAERFISPAPTLPLTQVHISPADRWILARLQRLIRRASELFSAYEYAAAKSEIEAFFWGDLADNYLEMAKQRLYDPTCPTHNGARFTLHTLLLTIIKLFAPILPYVTEEIYQGLFTDTTLVEQAVAAVETRKHQSIHRSAWPQIEPTFDDAQADALGETLIGIATAVRRYKSEHNLALGSEIKRVQLAAGSPEERQMLLDAADDIKSITRAQQIEIVSEPTGMIIEA
jgi:valyl-tRNA synthetase